MLMLAMASFASLNFENRYEVYEQEYKLVKILTLLIAMLVRRDEDVVMTLAQGIEWIFVFKKE